MITAGQRPIVDNRALMNEASETGAARVRLDKWLWAARLYKTRSIAADEIDKGRVSVNGLVAKPARELRIGDRIELRQGALRRELCVRGLSHVRGPAPVAQALYEETPTSVQARQHAAEQRRQGVEPALAIAHGRPTKQQRRQLTRAGASWQRWSVSIDDQ